MGSITVTRIATFATLLLASAATLPAAAPLGNVAGHCTFDKTKNVTFVDGVALPGTSFLDSKEHVTLVYVSSTPLSAFHPDLFVDPGDGRIRGTGGGTGGASGGDACQMTFDVPLVADYGAGNALPADGGEPGAAMRALWTSGKYKILVATDIAEMRHRAVTGSAPTAAV